MTNKLRCEICGELFDNDDPDITQEAVDDPDFLVTCDSDECHNMGLFRMGWAQEIHNSKYAEYETPSYPELERRNA